jgi:signal transduction histidine kinase
MIFQILTAICVFICLTLTIYALRMKHAQNTVIFALIMLQITILIIGSSFNPYTLIVKLLEIIYILFSVVLLLFFHKRIRKKYKMQYYTMAAGLLLLFLGFVLLLLFPDSRVNISITSILFTLAGILLFYSIFRNQLFPVIPAARDKFLDCIPEGILTVDSTGIIIDKNRGADKFIEDIFGVIIDPLGKDVETLLKSWPRWYLACKNMEQDELEINGKGIGANKYYFVKIYPVINKRNNKKVGTVSVLTDMTEKKEAEEELTNSLKSNDDFINSLTENQNRKIRLDEAIRAASDMVHIFVLDHNADFVYDSHNSDRIFTGHYGVGPFGRKGYNKSNNPVIGYFLQPVLKVLKGEKIVNLHSVVKKNEKDIHLLFNGFPLYDKNGGTAYGVYFILDITEAIRHENLVDITRHLADMNSLKDKLFSVFTHDIRNPIATMVSLVELLEQDKECYSEEFREIMEEVKNQVHYTYNIIENLLDWLNCQRNGIVLSPAKWKLSEIIKETISLYLVSADMKGIKLGYKLDKDFVIYTDKEILGLILRNLLSNAIKFTNQGGSVTIEAYETDKELTIAVTDTGIGMDEEKVRNLFHEGYISSTLGTAGEKGIGLGLLICKEFTLKIGGKIWTESIPGEGSTFYISLPVNQ